MLPQRDRDRPLLSVVVPAYNEEALLQAHLEQIVAYLEQIEDEFAWELIVVNDGSMDRTAAIIGAFAKQRSNIIALNHPRNFGLGEALRFGFSNTHGDIVVTLDIDLSYDVEHIGELTRVIRDQKVKMVLASPYAKGGVTRNVPWLRKTLSRMGNRFLRFFVKGRYSTLTSLVRGYDGPFIRALALRAMGMDIMPETIYKASILHASVAEIPARLDWGPQNLHAGSRLSSMRIARHIFATVFSGFIFRPFMFFVIPGLLIAAFSLYVNFWMFVHYFDALAELRQAAPGVSWSDGLALAYRQYPHTFIFGLLTAMLAIQLVGLGVMALQSKQYFEELFHLGSFTRRQRNLVTKRGDVSAAGRNDDERQDTAKGQSST